MSRCDGSWPPKSPHAALLSSPSGHRKFQQQAMPEEECDEDYDEETLKLELAAIEAKLKLKKLQQSKAKSGAASARSAESRPSTAADYTSVGDNGDTQKRRDNVDIPLSPVKRSLNASQPRSPGRVLLGIDKGATSAHVSLRRARATTKKQSDGALSTTTSARPSSRISGYDSAKSNAYKPLPVAPITSFSERMAQMRQDDRSQRHKQETTSRLRGPGTKIDTTELTKYRMAAEEAKENQRPESPFRRREESDFTRDDILALQRQPESHTRGLKKSRTLPNLRSSPSKASAPKLDNTKPESTQGVDKADSSLFESYSHLNLSSRILPHSFLKRSLPEDPFTALRVPDLLKTVVAPTYELPDTVINYAVFGVIASKSPPLDHNLAKDEKSKGSNDWERKWEDGSQNQKKFMVFTVTDLKWSIDLYIFGTAVPRYHRLTPGTVVAVVNPSIMPPKKGREDTNAFSLTLHSSDDTVLEIGTSRDLGFCNAVKKDGRQCGQWVNASRTEICEFHLNLQIAKMQGSRMGINTGSNGFGQAPKNKHNGFTPGFKNHDGAEIRGRGLLARSEGQRYDRSTGSQYFVSASNPGSASRTPIYRPELITAGLLDLDDDDPFIAEGQLSRNREYRLRKRMQTQAKERDIAKELVALGAGGAGQEYLKRRAEKTDLAAGCSQPALSSKGGSQRSALVTKNDIMNPTSMRNGNGKRTAEDVRLSPIKRTRFLTSQGVKEAGQDSMGGQKTLQDEHHNEDDDDDDDDLDIVR